MMRRLLSGLVLGVAFSARAAVAPADFPFSQNLRPPDPLPAAEALGGVVLGDDVLAELNPGRSNLRLLEADQREVPFLIRTRTERQTRTEERVVTVTPRSFRERPDNRAEIEFARPAHEPGRVVALLLHSAQANYEKLVTVSGSMDQQQWTVLAEAQPVYDYTRYIDVRNQRVALPGGEWAFYRVEIANLAEDRKAVFTEVIRQVRGAGAPDITETETARIRQEPFRVERMDVVVQREQAQAERPVLTRWAVPEVEVKHDVTARVTRVEFATRRQPVVALWLFPRDRNFIRRVTVSGADESGDAAVWEGLAQATVSRIETAGQETRLRVDLGSARRFRHYRIMLDNQDNPPLEITEVQAETETWEALFFAPGGPLRLFFGGPLEQAPQYDIGAVLAASPGVEPQGWTLAPAEKNPAYREPAPPKPARSGQPLLILAIVAMVGVLLVVIAKTAKQVE
jgi:hypothetical protein